MQYLGGKSKIRKPLGAYLKARLEGRYFVEPFCGALNITAEMDGPRLASDASPYLFSLYKAVREGWEPPGVVTEEEYAEVKKRLDPDDPLTAFVGYGCSFGGKFFGGYARAEGSNFPLYTANSLSRKLAKCTEVTFSCCLYRELTPSAGCLVYCDPPYADTTGYSAVGKFDSAEFWSVASSWVDRGAVVLVSEYAAPANWKCVWEVSTTTQMHGEGKSGRVERLFERA